MPNLLALIHGLDYLFLHFLLGTAVFHCCIVHAGGSDALALDKSWEKRIQILLGLTFLSSLAWMAATAAEMSESWKWLDLWQVMSHTEFGHLWCVRVVTLLILFFLARLLRLNRPNIAFIILVLLGLIAISSMTGHAGSQETGTAWRVPLFWLHSVAAGIWTGGLVGLYTWLGARNSHPDLTTPIAHSVVKRFSHFAMASTGIIFFTGLIAAISGGVSFWQPWATPYGQLVLAKTFLFSLALAAAAINQFVHLKKATQMTEIQFSRAIRREVLLEIIFVTIVFGIAGFLTRTDLPIS